MNRLRLRAVLPAALLIALLTVSVAADPQREPETRLSFEAATVKPAAPDALRNQVVPAGPNRLYIPGMTLRALIYAAYGDGGYNTSMGVREGPDWSNRTVFAVEGVAPGPATPRIVVSRSRPPEWVDDLAGKLNGVVVPMGSAGAKAMAVVLGAADIYVHEGGQWEWDSAAPVGVARAAGLHTSRLDGSPLTYNTGVPYLPDLVICRTELAAVTLHALGTR